MIAPKSCRLGRKMWFFLHLVSRKEVVFVFESHLCFPDRDGEISLANYHGACRTVEVCNGK